MPHIALGGGLIELGVNIDHVATIRQARKTYEPDPVAAAALAQHGGADGITFHLREDRRHIQDRDVEVLMATVTVKTNMEMAVAESVVDIAVKHRPTWSLLVPENRQEITTEGGLDVVGQIDRVREAVGRLKNAGILVSLFIDPDPKQIQASADLGVDAVELHTGAYALASGPTQRTELDSIISAGKLVCDAGMRLHAGHGLNYQNVFAIAQIPGMIELNIGHSIVSHAVMVGMREAVSQMKEDIHRAQQLATQG
ncbi:MAG: pyridoxine 5'-phosphate synthase [Planctomycetota bacterium]